MLPYSNISHTFFLCETNPCCSNFSASALPANWLFYFFLICLRPCLLFQCPFSCFLPVPTPLDSLPPRLKALCFCEYWLCISKTVIISLCVRQKKKKRAAGEYTRTFNTGSAPCWIFNLVPNFIHVSQSKYWFVTCCNSQLTWKSAAT